MSDWNDGYVSDISYTHGYYPELNPQRLPLLLLAQGYLPPPQLASACELGYGQGLTINMHAAAGVAQWHGTDFSPAQAGFAQELAAAAGAGARLHDEPFAGFCARPELPEFDFIALHGIWSWISPENRAAIIDFFSRRLRVGGVLYLSYNCYPGWAAFAPVQHLLAEHGDVLGVPGAGSIARVQQALDFTERLLATKPLFAEVNPQIAKRIEDLKGKDKAYLAHEYFNRNWYPMHFSDVARSLAPARLQYAGSANYLDALDVFNLTPEQQAFLAEIPNATLRQSARDFMINNQFRRDLWVKGLRRVSGLQQAEALRAQRVVLTTARAKVPLKVQGARGEATLKPEVYEPLLDLLADHKPRTLGQIEQALRAQGPFSQWLQSVLVLVGAGHAAPAHDEAQATKARKSSERLNASLLVRARASGEVGQLASPITGGGVPVGRFQQLFLLARAQGAKQPQDWGRFAAQLLQAQGQSILKDGKPLQTPEENLAELTAQAEDFAAHRLPVLRALGVA